MLARSWKEIIEVTDFRLELNQKVRKLCIKNYEIYTSIEVIFRNDLFYKKFKVIVDKSVQKYLSRQSQVLLYFKISLQA